MKTFKSLKSALVMTAATLGATGAACIIDRPAYAQEAARTYNIQAQDLDGALREFAMQTGRDVLYAPEIVAGRRSPGVRGRLTEPQALSALLVGTGLTYERTASNAYAVRASNGPLLGGAEVPLTEAVSTLPDILVDGDRSLNVDIRRTEDDPLPYVVFDAEEIARSGASTVEDFLKTRLPMNTSNASAVQRSDSVASNAGRINLRGLGANQTLVLVDGRRLPGVMSVGGQSGQPNINGIPLSAIDRIEVLPSTAGGIFGGGATGGVINVILKRQYAGGEFNAGYGNSFDTDAGDWTLGALGGFSINEGRTRVMMSVTHAESNALYEADRDFARRSRNLFFENNPSALLPPRTPPASNLPNICSANNAFVCSNVGLVLDNGTPLGASFTSAPAGYLGPLTDAGAALLARSGMYNLDLPNEQQSLLRTPTTDSASVNIRHEVNDSIDAFLDLRRDQNQSEVSITSGTQIRSTFIAAGSPLNPFQQGILVRFQSPGVMRPGGVDIVSLRETAGLIFRLPRRWSASLEQTWSTTEVDISATTRPLSAAGIAALNANALTDLTANPIDLNSYLLPTPDTRQKFQSELTSLSLRLSGPFLRVPGGDITWTGLFETRTEEIPSTVYARDLNNPSPVYQPYTFFAGRSQSVDSAYLEVRAPIVSANNRSRGIHDLELQASIREDHYQTTSAGSIMPTASTPEGPFAAISYFHNDASSTSVTLGARYQPNESLSLRASYATGFLPPALDQISPYTSIDPNYFYGSTIDPARGGEPLIGDADGNITITLGGNASLLPEDSTSWSAGVVYAPTQILGLRISADYTYIEKTNEILFGPSADLIVGNEATLPGRVTRGPRLPGDPANFSGPIVGLDLSPLNVASTQVAAYDFQVNYDLQTEEFGTFRTYAIATWQTRFARRYSEADSEFDTVGYVDGPLEWRGNAGVTWERGNWTANWNAQYFDSYSLRHGDPSASGDDDVLVTGQGTSMIPSQTYHDLSLRYRFDQEESARSTEVALGIQNIFDTRPPILASPVLFQTYSTYGDPRLRRFTLTIRKTF